MAIEQNTTKKITRNGFAAVTRMDIQNTSGVTLEQIEVIGALFRAIERLTTDQLCKHGALQADFQANDIDCLRECAVKAGVVGELVDEMVSGMNTVQ